MMYSTDDACLDSIFNQKFGNLKSCPECTKPTKFYRIAKRKCYACSHCGHQLHPLSGTIFHKSSTPLKLWFYAMFLFANSKHGVSGKELERQLGVTYKTAWRMAKQIRLLFAQDHSTKLKKTVEVDETYVGGRRKGPRGRGAAHKTPVVGIVQRGGDVRAIVTPNTKMKVLLPFILNNVKKFSTVMSDEYRSYRMVHLFGYDHHTITHGKYQWADGDCYTNTIEGFWSILKNSIRGTHRSVSRKHLQGYVDEFVFKYNQRNSEVPVFLKLQERLGVSVVKAA